MPKRKARRPHPPKPPPPPEGAILLGLDVSSRAAGVALARRGPRGLVVLDLRLFRPPSSWDAMRRIDYLADAVEAYVRVVDPLDLALMEWTDGAAWMARKHAGSWASHVVTLAAAQSAVRREVLRHAAKIETVTSTRWTNRVPKDVRAERLRDRYWTYRAWPLSRDPGYDVADGLGLLDWRAT